MTVHDLKTWPEPFQAIRDDVKHFELRKDDRGYQRGDTLQLREWDPRAERYTGRAVYRRITYVLAEGFGLPDGYCVMSIAQIEEEPVMDDVIGSLRSAAECGLGTSLDAGAVRDALARHDAAEHRGYKRGLREGREAERADVVADLRDMARRQADRVYWDLSEGEPLNPRDVSEETSSLADRIERAEHVPTPQGDEEVNHG